MTDDNQEKSVINKVAKQYVVADGAELFNSLNNQGYYVWKVGQNYYLWVDNEVLNIEKSVELRKALEHILKTSLWFAGESYSVFMNLCRKRSLSFDLSVKAGKDPEEIEAYKKIKSSNPKSKEFFRNWVLKYVYPQ